MIEPPPKDPSLKEAAEWIIRALKDEDLPVLFCGRAAIDYQGEYTGTADIDILVGTDFHGANYVFDAYVNRKDLFPVGATQGEVICYLVSGFKAVDVMNVSAIHPDLFGLLKDEASVPVLMGTAGSVDAVSREGYFVLAIMIGLVGFARYKPDPMLKVREAWELFGARTDEKKVDQLLRKLGERTTLRKAIENPC